MESQRVFGVLRPSLPAIALAAVTSLVWFAGCSDGSSGPDIAGQPTPASGLIISNPVPSSAPATRIQAGATLTGINDNDVVYVSLPPGTSPGGVHAIVERIGATVSLTATVENGGFDPLPVAAQSGDTIDVMVVDGSDSVVYENRVAVSAPRPLVVVRTDPPPRKRDVPLNAHVVVVFSEPVDPSTLTSVSVQLLQGTTSVAGTVEVQLGTSTAVVFDPASPLAANTDYQLVVTRAVRGVGGEVLAAEMRVEFTTGSGSVGQVGSVLVFPDSARLIPGAQLELLVGSSDSSGLPVSGLPITWASDNPSVASAGASGLVTAVSAGSARVTATVHGTSATATIIVVSPSIRVAVTTGGSDSLALDADGYTVTLDSSVPVPIGNNGEVTFSPVARGTHTVTLGGLSPTCLVVGGNGAVYSNPATVNMTIAPATTLFHVACALFPLDSTAVVAFVRGYQIFTIGAHAFKRLSIAATDRMPGWSPDGRRLVFASFRGDTSVQHYTNLYTMSADGSSISRLTNIEEADWEPAWSPTGARIAFARTPDGLSSKVYVMNADGSGVTQLTSDGASPAWSPDGRRVAYYSANAIHLVNADGTQDQQLISVSNSLLGAGGLHPSWSPDGTQIAFSDGHYGIAVTTSGVPGTAVTIRPPYVSCTAMSDSLTECVFHGFAEPSWSPDGRSIAVDWRDWVCRGAGIVGCQPDFGHGSGQLIRFGIGVIGSDGSGLTKLTSDSLRYGISLTLIGLDQQPAWRP